MKRIYWLLCIFLIGVSLNAWSQEDSIDASSAESKEQQEIEEEVKEKKYVTDKLRLSLYKQADSSSGTIRLLISGDILYVLSRSGPYSKVRTEQGETGWVKNGFLQVLPTSTFQLKEEQDKNAALTQKLEKLANSEKLVEEFENTIEQLNAEIDKQQIQIQAMQQDLQGLDEEKKVLLQRLDSEQQGTISLEDIYKELEQYWYIGALTIILIFLIGYFIGKETVESQVRKRFQGVKVW